MGATDPILCSGTEHGRCYGHGGIGAYLHAIDVKGSRRTVQGNGHMMPSAAGSATVPSITCSVDEAGFDRKANCAGGPVLRRQEHVVGRSGTEIEDPRPVASRYSD